MQVLKLTGKHRELVQILASQFVVREIHLCVIIVNGFDHRPDHLRWRVGLPARRNFVQRMGKLRPRFLRFGRRVHRQQSLAKIVAGVADPGWRYRLAFHAAVSARGYSQAAFP